MAVYFNTPNFENNYFVRLNKDIVEGKEYLGPEELPKYWKDPRIAPYIPQDDRDLIAKVKKNETIHFFTHVHNKGLLVSICVYLDPKDLAQFSEVNSYCYLAKKADVLWETQLKKLVSRVHFLPPTLITFNYEQQFQIFFKFVQDYKKPFVLQKKYEERVVVTMRELLESDRMPELKPWMIYEELREAHRQVAGCDLALKSIPSVFDDQIYFVELLVSAEKRKREVTSAYYKQMYFRLF